MLTDHSLRAGFCTSGVALREARRVGGLAALTLDSRSLQLAHERKPQFRRRSLQQGGPTFHPHGRCCRRAVVVPCNSGKRPTSTLTHRPQQKSPKAQVIPAASKPFSIARTFALSSAGASVRNNVLAVNRTPRRLSEKPDCLVSCCVSER